MKRVMQSKIMQYTAVFEPDKKAGGYTVSVPALPGCLSEGETFEEARKNITEAAQLYIEVMHDQKESIPHEEGIVVAPVKIKI